MRVFVFSLITAGSFMMLSADTRGIDLPSAEWCSTGTLVPVAEFHFYPDAFEGLQQATPAPRGPVFKMVGEFDDDYPTDPREEEEEEEDEVRTRSILPPGALPKMVGEFDDDYPTDPREEEEEEEGENRVRSALPENTLPKMVGEFDDDYPTDPREEEEEEVEQARTALAMASAHCEQFTLAKRSGSDRGEVIAVAEWPLSLVDANDAGRYSLKQGAAGLCLRCE
jgi:hypothetical protein